MKDYRTWYTLVTIRILWCVIQQTGYIHPDEFFQNPEPMAGDVFGYEVKKPWEFDPKFPCRSAVLPYLTSGLTFKVINFLHEQDLVKITSAILVVLPRLTMTLLSLVIDYSIFKMCNILNFDPHWCLAIFASSFVTLVFYTRTLSNSLEAILFAALLALVVDTRKNYFLLQENKIEDDNVKMKKEQEKELKQNSDEYIVSDKNDKSLHIAVILVTGFFNRPTFAFFALVPMLFWIVVDGSGKKSTSLSSLLANVLKLLPGLILSTVVFIVIDSQYYGSLDTSYICCMHSFVDFLSSNFLQNLTVTPLNFLQYNLDGSNLAEHGIHPHITHLLVNAPLLFLPLMVCFASEIIASIMGNNSGWQESSLSPKRVFFQLSFFTPLLLLSFFPHQEPRFLIPLLTPLVLLYSGYVLSSNNSEPNMPWIVWNLLACLIFGVLHQGGLVPCLGYLSNLVSKADTNPVHYHIVFYHTYMPPQHLLTWKDPKVSGLEMTENQKFPNILTVYDLAGTDRLTMHNIVENLYDIESSSPYDKEIFIISPSSLDRQFCRTHIKFNFQLQKQFTPHLSTEDLPELFGTYNCVNDPNRSYDNLSTLGSVKSKFSLNLYKVVPGR